LERARYEAQRAEHQYDVVDPEHRLVARTLERRWNEKLQQLQELEQAYTTAQRTQRLDVTPQERQQILRLAADLPALWPAPEGTPRAAAVGAGPPGRVASPDAPPGGPQGTLRALDQTDRLDARRGPAAADAHPPSVAYHCHDRPDGGTAAVSRAGPDPAAGHRGHCHPGGRPDRCRHCEGPQCPGARQWPRPTLHRHGPRLDSPSLYDPRTPAPSACG